MLTSGPFRPAADVSSLYALTGDWLVPGIIPAGGLVILASSPKTGKTCFATALARAVAKGEPFLGHPIPQHPVLWCAYEETPRERAILHEGLTIDDPFLVAYLGDLPPLPHRIGRTDRYGRRDLSDCDPPEIFEHAREVGAKLIVIDCLHAAVEGICLADNTDARSVMGLLRTWSFHYGVSVLVLHHLTKSGTRGHQPERFADSAQILAAASCHFFMDREELPLPLREDGSCFPEGEGAGGSVQSPIPQSGSSLREGDGGGSSPPKPIAERPQPTSRIVLHGKGRHPAPYPRIELISEGPLDYRLADDTAPAVPRKLNAQDRVRHLLTDGWCLTASDIARKLQMNPTTVRYALARLQEDGDIKVADKLHRAPRYTATDQSDKDVISPAGSCQQQHQQSRNAQPGTGHNLLLQGESAHNPC